MVAMAMVVIQTLDSLLDRVALMAVIKVLLMLDMLVELKVLVVL
jgi:hypothetical protein